MRALNFSMIKLSIYLILGIILGQFISVPAKAIFFITAALLIFLFIVMQLFKTKFDDGFLVGLIIFLCTVSTGILTSTFHDQRQFSNHYVNFIPSSRDSLVNLTFKIREVLKPGTYHNKYVVDVTNIELRKAKGRLLLNIEKDSINEKIQVDQIFFTRTSLQKINTPLNPHQFDYNNYLSYKYIFYQLNLPSTSIFKVHTSDLSILGYAASIRQSIQESLSHYNFQADELSIINALLLGQRQDISKEIYDNYAQAGAIHILAVSGLHIGIILLLLQRLLRFLDFIKKGKLLRILLILAFLWSYAIVAGLSASIVRAVTMFTVFAIAMNLKRPTNVYNTIAISIFILLLFKPNFLFDVGFSIELSSCISYCDGGADVRKIMAAQSKYHSLFLAHIDSNSSCPNRCRSYKSVLFSSVPRAFLFIEFSYHSLFRIYSWFRNFYYRFVFGKRFTSLDGFFLWINHQLDE